MASSDRRVVAEHELLLHLQGIDGPITTSGIVAHARCRGAPARVLATLEALPECQWRSVEEAAAAVGVGGDPRHSDTS